MTNEPRAGNGLDPELLAAYIDQRLPPDERAAIEAKLAADPESYELLVELIHANEALKGETPAGGDATEPADREEPQARTGAVVPLVPKPKRMRGWAIAGGVFAAAAALVLVVRVQPDLLQRLRGGDAVDPQLAKLVAAVGEERYIEARLTGGFKYGQLRSVTRGSSLADRNLALLGAAGELQKIALQNPSAASLHAWGVAQLLLGEAADAVATLEDAATRAPADRKLLVDLSASLLARARGGDAAAAFDAISRAIALGDESEEALYNKALALQRMGLARQAAQAWQEFLDRHPGSPWRSDAQAYQEQLRSQLSRRCDEAPTAADPQLTLPAECRSNHARAFETVHLAHWARAVEAGSNADTQLLTLTQWASVLSTATGDQWPVSMVGALRRDSMLGAALAKYSSAVTAIEADRLTEAESLLASAVPVLRASHNPAEYTAELHLAMLDAQKRHLVSAKQRLDYVHAQTMGRGYLAIAARESWLRGVVAIREAQPAKALEYYRTAVAIYDQVGLIDLAAGVRNAQADTERLTGLLSQGLGTLQDALAVLPAIADQSRRYLILFNAALYAELQALPHASLAFEDEAVLEAATRKGSLAIVEALVYRARFRTEVGRSAEATSDLDTARARLGEIEVPNLRSYLAARIQLAQFEATAMAGQASEASVREAIAFFSRAEPTEVPRLWSRLARTLSARGDFDAALAAVRSGIARFESDRAGLESPELQANVLDASWDLYGQAVELLVHKGDPAGALHVSQRPSLLRFSGVRGADAADLSAMSARLTPGSALLVFSQVADHLYWWLLRGDRPMASGRLAERASTIGALAADVLRSARADDGAALAQQGMRRVSAAVIGGLDLGGIDLLGVMPDGVIADVPLAALWNAATGRFLIEDMRIGICINTAPREGDQRATTRRALVIANDGAASGVPWLRPLPAAVREGEAIAAMYASSRLLLGKVAHSTVFEAFKSADVIHFAGHAVANTAMPSMSALVIGGADAPLLYAYQLAALPHSGGKTIVLAACETASGRAAAGLGADSLARPFLTAGATTVIAATRPIDDQASLSLFSEFHRRFSESGDALASLREAQLSALRRRESLSNWSVVVPIISNRFLLHASPKEMSHAVFAKTFDQARSDAIGARRSRGL